MPRIHAPNAVEVKQHPREFSLLRQLTTGEEIDASLLAEYVKLYGSDPAKQPNGEMSFSEFASLFAKPASSRGASASDPATNCLGWAAKEAGKPLEPFAFDRRPVGPHDIRIQIAFAGICHSDVHQARDEWGGSLFPMVPGHEIAGIVTEVGSEVTAFAPGDRAGVGCMVDSCRACSFCAPPRCEEQFCAKCVYTYNSKHADGSLAHGGYSTHLVVRDCFALRLPSNLPLDETAPLMCAGITVYSPMKTFGLDKPGMKIGVVGLGGLGHMAVKLGKGLGLHVTVISTSPGKKEEAIKVLGADAFIVSKNEEEMKALANSLDGIIDTVSAQHDLGALVGLLKVDGKLVLVGVPDKPMALPQAAIIFKRCTIAGSLIGSIQQTQEMLDLCGEKGIGSMVERIPIEKVNEAYERMIKSDVRYRFVIDIQGSLIN
ncbi:hypothetical protein HYH03_017613 [Edaphochlamys debaryana]|uniref:Enoyl reductase (ER) domain-containing protein n=1 Tax=Edaphochlamys debaryana TaxID=47281 RepID=A0A835XIP0_9CHLO|nr:hypothetical protein HYH03_017613 [Edaphochlamys debaryana]|eukprot:KAG2483503.1 hypothetical protein HYH03_017613 [Edaphochlamys debaryana]